jgi:uncharacterized protein (TIGR00730 family)
MERNSNSRKTIAVFGGSRVERDSPQYAEAYQVGARLAQAGFTVLNGGYAGTMEASAKGAREAGGRVVGVSSKLFTQNVLNEFIDEEIPTDDLYNRIRELIVRGDGYIVLRGSIGTLAELHIVWNLATLEPGFDKVIVLLGDFWKDVIQTYERTLAVDERQTRYLQFASTPEECVEILQRRLNDAPTPLAGGEVVSQGDAPLPRAPSPPNER